MAVRRAYAHLADLARMLADRSLTGYTYAEAAAVLAGLGFELAPQGAGSHRKWRKRVGTRAVIVGLVQGGGTLKPYLVRDMLKQLRENALIGTALEDGK